MRPTTVRRPDLAAALSMGAGIPGSGFIGPEILPVLIVSRQADTFAKPVFTDKALTIDIAALARAPKADYKRLNYRTTTDSFATKDEGLEDSIDDVQGRLVAGQFDAERDCANGLCLNVRRAAEIAYATYLFDAASLFASYKGDVSTEWDTAATATPYNDVQDAFTTIVARLGGVLPAGVERCVAMSAKVFRNCYTTTDIKVRRAGGSANAKSTPQGIPSRAELAQVLDVDQVFVGNAKNGTADVWDDEYCLAYLRFNGQATDAPQLGRTFVWRDDGDSDFIVETYREEPRRTVVLIRNNVQRYAFNAMCGHLLGNITT